MAVDSTGMPWGCLAPRFGGTVLLLEMAQATPDRRTVQPKQVGSRSS